MFSERLLRYSDSQSSPPRSERHSRSWSLSQQQQFIVASPSVFLLMSFTHVPTDRFPEQISRSFTSIFMNISINVAIMLLYVTKDMQVVANHQQIITSEVWGWAEPRSSCGPPVAHLALLTLLLCKNVGDPSHVFDILSRGHAEVSAPCKVSNKKLMILLSSTAEE